MALNKKIILVNFAVLIAGSLIGGTIIHSYYKSQETPKASFKAIRQGGYQYINPLLECENTDENAFIELRSFKSKIESRVQEFLDDKTAEHISVYYRDLNNGPWFGIDERETFSPASLLKTPLMMAYLKEAESKPEILTNQYVYEGDLDETGKLRVYPPISLEKDKSYSVNELISRMIRLSDNAATDLLSRNLSKESSERPYKILGIDSPFEENFSVDTYNVRIKDYASFFRMLYNSSFLNAESSEKALELLASTEFKDGITRNLPKSVKVAHKFGERTFGTDGRGQLHDCGIVYYPGHPYILCVMTKGENLLKLPVVLAEISRITYQEIDIQVKSID